MFYLSLFLPGWSDQKSRVVVMAASYDVVIIGAGPAGSTAARGTASAGLSTLLLEKRQEIGAPVRCAEAVGYSSLSRFVEPDPKWIARVIDGVRLVAPDGGFVDIVSPGNGFVLERKIFDRHLAELAAAAGAEVRVKSRATGLVFCDGRVSGVCVRSGRAEETIEARLVIAADGVESQVGRWAGLETGCTLSGIDICAQYLLSGVKLERPEYCYFYFGRDIAPGGYAWAFPKGEDTANVGLGIRPNPRRPVGETAKYFLDRFVSKVFPEAVPVSFVIGAVPTDGKHMRLSGPGIMVAGDAAHQTDPLTGGGIANAMIAGKLAAEAALKAFQKGDFSRASLSAYDRKWHKKLGKRVKHLVRLRDEIVLFQDETYNKLVNMMGRGGRSSLIEIFRAAFANKPSLLIDIGKLLFYGWFGREGDLIEGFSSQKKGR
jgi:digeranylgeranylglycerophospholipid reductase